MVSTPGLVEGDSALVKVLSNGAESNSVSMGQLGLISATKPLLEWLDGAAFAAAGGDAVLRGSDLLQGQTFDTIALGTGTAGVTFTCLKPGVSSYNVVIVQGTTLASVLSGSLLTVTLATAGNTADEVATAVNVAASTKGVIRAVSGGGGTVLISDSTPMAGGTGLYAGNKVLVSGVEALPKHATGTNPAATWTETAVTVTVPALTGASPARAAGDTVLVRLSSNGFSTGPLSNVLA
jgi:hypothetical protein